MMTKKNQTYLALALASFLFFSCHKEENRIDLERGLVAYYPFDGNAEDKSSFENHGITYNAVFETNRFGATNSSMVFDGDTTYFFAEHQPQLNFQNEFTLAVWIKNDLTWGTDYFIEKGAPLIETLNRSTFGLARSGTGDFVLSVTSNIDEKPTQARTGNAPVNTWNHLTGIYSNDSLKLYLKGDLVAKNKFSKSLLTNSEPIYLGSIPGERGPDGQILNVFNRFKGKMDEVRIYNRALNEEEILKLQEL